MFHRACKVRGENMGEFDVPGRRPVAVWSAVVCVGASGGKALSWGRQRSIDTGGGLMATVRRRVNKEKKSDARARKGETDMTELARAPAVSPSASASHVAGAIPCAAMLSGALLCEVVVLSSSSCSWNASLVDLSGLFKALASLL